jgi:hypothetical protein
MLPLLAIAHIPVVIVLIGIWSLGVTSAVGMHDDASH